MSRPKLDRFELLALVAFTLLAYAVLIGLGVRTLSKGGVISGADGFLAVDVLQYLNWIRQASEHVLIENLYDIAPSERVFLHPGILLAGVLHKLGLGLIASYQLMKLVAVGVLFSGFLLYVRRFLSELIDRRVALVIALFAASPLAALVGWAELGGSQRKFEFDLLSGEIWTGNYLWGYVFTGIAVGLLPLGLLAYERGRAGGRGSMLVWAALCGLLVSWMQPWQGATFAFILGGAELVLWRLGRRAPLAGLRDLALPVAATAAPLVYYLVLSKTDPAWELAGTANEFPIWPLWVMVVGLAPLAAPAVLAYKSPSTWAHDFGPLALRLWPLAALAVFYQPAGTFPFHSLQGLQLPLATLAVLALRPLRLGAAVAAVALLVVPGTLYRVDQMRDAIQVGRQPHFLEPEELDALRWLDREERAGGVITPVYLGLAIPAYTERQTWVGAGSWTPGLQDRIELTEDLFGGRMEAAEAEELVRESGARFLLSDCHGRADIAQVVEGFAEPPQRFGCATVWEVRD